MVRSVASVAALEVVIVNFLDNGVEVRLSHLHSLVLIVESLGTNCLEVYGITNVLRLDRLTAAVYTAAGTTHDLNEGPVCLAACDLVHNDLCVSSAGSNANLDIHTCDVVGSLLETLSTTNLAEYKLLVVLSGENVVSGSESRLHNAAGSTEDNCSAGVNAERTVKLLVGKSSELNAGSADHSCKLTGGESYVNVSDTLACSRHIISAYLELLCGTRHDGYNEDILCVDAHLISPVGLDKSAAHLLGRLAGGEMTDVLGIVVLAELNPSGRAGGDHRKLAAVLNTLKKLGSLLNDGEISSGVGVEYLLEAESSESCNHLALNVSADRHIEALAESCTDGGSGLNYYVLGRIVESIPYLIGIVTLNESTGRTYSGTLTAGDTGSITKVEVEGLTDAGIDTTVVSTDYRYELLVTNSNATTAENTLVVVSYKVRSGEIKRILGLETTESGRIYAVLKAELLKLAVSRTNAGETVLVVSGEDELESSLTSLANLLGVGVDLHTLGYGIYASGNKTSGAGSLNNTDTASTDLVLFLHIAESGDLHTCNAGCLKNGRALGYANCDTVNFNI